MSDLRPTFVVGYDASEESNAALAHAARLADGGRIVVVHAHEPAPRQLDARWRAILSADQEQRSQAVLAELPDAIARRLSGISWETISVDGPPADALRRVADEVGADAIVVGTRGAGVVQALLGSVARALVQSAERPVLIIPPGSVRKLADAGR